MIGPLKKITIEVNIHEHLPKTAEITPEDLHERVVRAILKELKITDAKPNIVANTSLQWYRRTTRGNWV